MLAWVKLPVPFTSERSNLEISVSHPANLPTAFSKSVILVLGGWGK
jgi:hypothetical protein